MTELRRHAVDTTIGSVGAVIAGGLFWYYGIKAGFLAPVTGYSLLIESTLVGLGLLAAIVTISMTIVVLVVLHLGFDEIEQRSCKR